MAPIPLHEVVQDSRREKARIRGSLRMLIQDSAVDGCASTDHALIMRTQTRLARCP